MKRFFKSVGSFFVEIWYRLGLPSPTIFLVIQWISASVVFVSGLPQLLLQYQAELHVTFPAWMFIFSNKAAFIAGIIGFFISKLTVKNTDAVKVKKNGDIKTMLPFTQPKKLSEASDFND